MFVLVVCHFLRCICNIFEDQLLKQEIQLQFGELNSKSNVDEFLLDPSQERDTSWAMKLKTALLEYVEQPVVNFQTFSHEHKQREA